jgi:hypothetical protein
MSGELPEISKRAHMPDQKLTLEYTDTNTPSPKTEKSHDKSIAASIALGLLLVAAFLAMIFLLYTQDPIRPVLALTIPSCLLATTILAITACRISDHRWGRLVLAGAIFG